MYAVDTAYRSGIGALPVGRIVGKMRSSITYSLSMPTSHLSRLRARVGAALRLRPRLLRECVGELVGTFVLLLLGDGVMAQTFLGDRGRYSHGDFLVVSLGWGLAVMLGVLFASRTGKGLINPAVTAAFWLSGRVSAAQAAAFSLAQLIGAFFGAATVFGVYWEHLAAAEPQSGLFSFNGTGHVFCTRPSVSHRAALLDQVVGTALLAGGALAVVDPRGLHIPEWAHAPVLALLVTAIVGAFGLNAGAALNPARDLGPRLFILAAGYEDAFSNNRFYFWVPVVGPVIGAILGVVFFELLIGLQVSRGRDEEDKEEEAEVMELTAACQ